jgi:hypothetical protein
MYIFDYSFLKDFLSNLLATFVGVIIGIPVALWLSRLTEHQEHMKEARTQREDTAKLLALLRKELVAAQDKLNYVRGQNTHLFAALELATRLRDDAWQSFKLSGRLQLLQSLDLLNAVSAAFASIQELAYLGRAYFASGELIRKPASYDFTPFIEGFVQGSASKGLESIERAITAIDDWHP